MDMDSVLVAIEKKMAEGAFLKQINGRGLPVLQGVALTPQLTTLAPADEEGTPDYATAAITNVAPFGMASAQEFITLLYVVKNLQVRMLEVEAALSGGAGGVGVLE